MNWCWRCQMVVPMLNAEEFAQIRNLYSECIENFNKDQEDPECEGIFHPLIQMHEAMTGVLETNENAIMHHELAHYGPLQRMSQLLRTPIATQCFECGEFTELSK